MLLKTWLTEKAIQAGIGYGGAYRRYRAGEYPNLKIEHKTKRTVLVVGE